MKALILIFCLLVQALCIVCLNIECGFDYDAVFVLPSHYRCNVQNMLNINSRESKNVISASGSHQSLKSNYDVVQLNIHSKNTKFFPKGIENIFPNLQVIRIYNGRLVELIQSDLIPVPNLVELFLGRNDIEVLEDGLFAYNKELQVISFNSNKISHIDAGVFDHLVNLKYFYIATCVTNNADNDISKVQAIIKETKIKCVDPNYQILSEKLKTLESESNQLKLSQEDLQEFEEKITNLETEVTNSKFKNFTKFEAGIKVLRDQISKRLSNLRNSNYEQACDLSIQQIRCSELAQQVDKLIKQSCSETDDSHKENGLQTHENIALDAMKDDLRELKETIDVKIEMLQKHLVEKLEDLFENKLTNMKLVTKVEL